MTAAFQGQLELRETTVVSDEICHRYSLHKTMSFSDATKKNILTLVPQFTSRNSNLKYLNVNVKNTVFYK